MASRFVRKVRTSSGAVAVQVVTREGRVVVGIDHVGSAHTDAELALLLEAAQQRLRPGQDAFDLGALERRGRGRRRRSAGTPPRAVGSRS